MSRTAHGILRVIVHYKEMILFLCILSNTLSLRFSWCLFFLLKYIEQIPSQINKLSNFVSSPSWVNKLMH